MFFIFGMNQGRKDLNYNQQMTCDICGRMGQYRVWMTYMSFSIFFIPVFKWRKIYYVVTSCCGSVYELRPETGRAIEHGQNVSISTSDLYLKQKGAGAENRKAATKICYGCAYEAPEDFEFCPRCGKKF
ncbi:zinc ribbon domain-containing protein [Oribacterium sp. WCC10]|uniref:zinc ribbon domain-containing protein n=1 Tax=Oribacterium sp. WCC10 TaxID=1855343 RepID=UPI0008E0FDDC|nr:zinc ribbon domain-containing protein [Oribacterium sp. WCC10]SFG06722.1 zinc-ribbon family protein [Oribacterium sp. WCC10]